MLGRLPGKLKARVEIEVSGPGLERFFNLCLQRGIVLKEIQWLNTQTVLAEIPARDFALLRPVLRQSNCSLRLRRRLGLPFYLLRLQRRKMLVLGGLLCILCFYIAGNFVLDIRVSGPYELERSFKLSLLEAAPEAGIKIGRPRWNMDFDAAERQYLRKFPSLVWVDISFRGTVVHIQAVERTDIEEEDRIQAPGHIVAAKDGLIQDMLVRRGTPLAEAGDTVSAGDLLIAGEDLSGPVAASGIVRARVWYEGYGESAVISREMAESGREYRQILLQWGGKPRLRLAGGEKIPFGNFSQSENVVPLVVWRKIKLPVEVVIIDYAEQQEQIREIEPEQAWDFAQERARQAALRELPLDGEILDTQILRLPDEGETKRVKITLEVLEDIAVFKSADEDKLRAREHAAPVQPGQ